MPRLSDIHAGDPEQQKAPSEGLTNEVPLLELDLEDEELVERINKSMDVAMTLYEKIRQRANVNRAYWKGNQLDPLKLKDYQSKMVTNLLFRNMETMLPIITKNSPLVNFISSNKEFDAAMEQLMVHRWEVEDGMLEKGRHSIRANFLDLLGVLKYQYDEDIKWKFIKTRNVLIDPDSTSIEDTQFVAEYVSKPLKDVIEQFPDKKDELLKELGVDENDPRMGRDYTFIEFWTPEFVVWKAKDIILDKNKNPNWDWGIDEKVDDEGEKETTTYNLWDKPRVPYIFFQTFTLGETVYADTSLFEQTIPLQDGFNKRKRQISDNADEANGILVGSGEFISKAEFKKIDNEPNLKVWGNAGNASQGLVRIPGNPLQAYVFNDMQHTENELDNIWGIHAITRGESGKSDTATAKVLQQKQDFGRIDDIVKAYEDFNEQYYQANFQMMLVHYDEEHVYSFEEEDDLVVSRQDIIAAYSKTTKRKLNEATGEMDEITEEGDFRPPIIMVKRGSTLPTDEVTRRAEALELAGAGAISIIDLYEKLGWPDPRESAKNLILQKMAPEKLFPELAEGAEEGPTEGAKEDFMRIAEGRQTPPNAEVQDPNTAGQHIKSHEAQFDSQEFQALEPQLQQMFVEHVKQELEIAKQVLGQMGGANEAQGVV